LLDYEQAHEIDPEDETIKDRISKVYYEFGVDKYNEKLYEVSLDESNFFHRSLIINNFITGIN
jgi:hypothetical protein